MSDDDTERLAAVFDRSAGVYDSAIPFFGRFGERLVGFAEVVPGERVIDVACGRGASLIPAAHAVIPGGEVLGVDLAPAMVEHLRADLGALRLDHAKVRVGNALHLDVPDASFDVALSGFAVMLLPDPGRAVAELARVVQPGGRVAISVPTGAGPEWSFMGELVFQFIGRVVGPLPPPPGPPLDLVAILQDAGLFAVRIADESEDFTFATPETWWRWVWSQGMRTILEALPDDALADFRSAAESRLAGFASPDGSIPLRQDVRYAVAERPRQ